MAEQISTDRDEHVSEIDFGNLLEGWMICENPASQAEH